MNKSSNQGFSLVEMIVSVLITAILMLGVVSFISASRVIYQHIGTSSKIQEEARTTTNFGTEILLEATNICVADPYHDTESESTICYAVVKSMPNDEGAAKRKSDGSIDYDYYFFLYSVPDGQTAGEAVGDIRYVKVDDGDELYLQNIADSNLKITTMPDSMKTKYIKNQLKVTGSTSTDYKYNIISQCVSNADVSKKNGNLITVSVEYFFNGTRYTSNYSVHSRNTLETEWK